MTGSVDHSSIKVNQGTIISLIILGFLFNTAWVVYFVAVVMAAGTVLGRPGYLPLYMYVLKPLKLVKPEVLADHAEPHRFAQGLGASFLMTASASFLLGAPTLGWTLAWMVAILAALNLFVGFCAGCAVYYWLNRLNVPGFNKSSPAGVFPGLRPTIHISEQ